MTKIIFLWQELISCDKIWFIWYMKYVIYEICGNNYSKVCVLAGWVNSNPPPWGLVLLNRARYFMIITNFPYWLPNLVVVCDKIAWYVFPRICCNDVCDTHDNTIRTIMQGYHAYLSISTLANGDTNHYEFSPYW